MDEAKRETIRKEARQILQSFGESLKKVKIEKGKSESKEEGFRKEGDGSKSDEDFRERMFDNAPSKEGDFIIAEKKKW